MTDGSVESRYRNRVLTIICAILLIAALRSGFAVIMPIVFAAIIVAALWPLKRWLARYLPSWLAYALTLLSLIAILVAFAAAVYLSIGQVIGAMAAQWAGLERGYARLAGWAADRGVPITGTLNRQRVVALLQMLASGAYAFVTYVGSSASWSCSACPKCRGYGVACTRCSRAVPGATCSRSAKGFRGRSAAISAPPSPPAFSPAWPPPPGRE